MKRSNAYNLIYALRANMHGNALFLRVLSFLILEIANMFANGKDVWQKQPPEVFCKKDLLRNFAKFLGNTCVSLFFNKVAGLGNCLIKLGVNQAIAPEEKCPPVRVRGWVRVNFGVGGSFPWGQLS